MRRPPAHKRAESAASRPVALAALGLTAATLLAACGSSSAPAPAGTAPASTAPASAAPQAGIAPATASGQLPSVQNATNLDEQPTIGAGTPPPPTTLLTRDLAVGTGATASPTSTVTVEYVGALYDTGQVFDSTWGQEKLQPFDLNGGVIAGFSQGIAGMKVGGRREIVIPPQLGYGPQGSPPQIPPNATLVFVVDLKKVS